MGMIIPPNSQNHRKDVMCTHSLDIAYGSISITDKKQRHTHTHARAHTHTHTEGIAFKTSIKKARTKESAAFEV